MAAEPAPTAVSHETKPTESDIDVFGLTDRGTVRETNEDHFLVASLHKVLRVHQTNVPYTKSTSLMSDSRGWVFLVADGLGGGPGGQMASETALQEIAHYVTHAMDLYTSPHPEVEARLVSKLLHSVEQSHQAVRTEAEGDGSRGAATTLTMVMVLWPRAYLVHVGDSRCYRLRRGALELLTRDQTVAQYMVDTGALSPEQAERSRLKHVLWSALGGRELAPDTASSDCEWEDVLLLCTDGLTKHVTDEEIRQHLLAHHSSEETCRRLVALALERGGTDNVTVVVGQLRPRPEAPPAAATG